MKTSLLKLKTNSYLNRNKTLRSSMPYKQAANVGILFSVENKQKHDYIKDLIKKLQHDGKVVSVMSFLPKKSENYEFLFDFFTDQDFNFWGNINSNSVSTFSETPFDYLFYLDTKPNPLILNLLAKSKAKCRVGKFVDSNKPYFELMIESVDGLKGLIDAIYKYTSLLR